MEPGYPISIDPAIDYETVGLEVVQNVYQTLITYDGNSTDSFLPVLATCVPGTSQCVADYGRSLVVNGTGPLTGKPEYWTFVIDPSARFYDPQTAASWGVYPSDVMFSVARDLSWANPMGITPGWILAQALLPAGNQTWDASYHAPYNNTAPKILGSMLVNDSRYCPQRSPGVFVGHGCITFVADGGGNSWPYFLELLADNLGASIVPCGWFTAQSAGLPGWSGTHAVSGDGSCALPDGGNTTNSSAWASYLSSLSPTLWDGLEYLLQALYPGVDSSVQWHAVGSGPYYILALNSSDGYDLAANPAYAAPIGCQGLDGLVPYNGTCDPSPGSYLGRVDATWESGDGFGLTEMRDGVADYVVPSESDISNWTPLENAGTTHLEEIPSDSLFELNFNLFWNSTNYYDRGFPGNLTIPSDFFAGSAVRGLLAESYPYASIENSVWTTDGIRYQSETGGPIPRHLEPYSSSIYPPSGNVSFPNGTPSSNANISGTAAWWWTQGTDPSSPYFDPELAGCSQDSPCVFPIVTPSSPTEMGAAANQLIQSISTITDDAVTPFLVEKPFASIINNLSGPTQNPIPVYLTGWAPDYPDPTDYFAAYAEPSSVYAWHDAVGTEFSVSEYNQPTSCTHYANATFADLVYWAHQGEISSACEGVAYDVALPWMTTAASLPAGASRVLDYNLITQVLNELALYTWVGQPNEVVAVAPWINASTLNSNPMEGGNGAQLWFELNYASSSKSSSTSTPVGVSPGTPLYDRLNGEIYVPDTGSATVSVLSGATHQLLANISVGDDPQTPVLDPQNGRVFVANFGSDNVSAINGSSNLVLKSFPVGTGPRTPVFDPADGLLFVPNNGSANLSLINATLDVRYGPLGVGAEPTTPVLDSHNGELYVPNFGSGNVTVIEPANFSYVTGIPVGLGPGQPAYDPSAGDIYVPNLLSNNVSVIWDVTNKVVATVVTGTAPFLPGGAAPHLFSRTTAPAGGPLFDPSNGNVYVVNAGTDNVTVISGGAHKVVGAVSVGAGPQAPVLDSSTGNIYVANNGSANVSVISGSTNGVVASLPAGANPAPPVVDNASGSVYLPNTGSSNVSAVNSSYYVTFHETGLPTNASWHVVLDSSPSTLPELFHRTTVPFGEGNGTYTYVIVGPSGYDVNTGTEPVGQVTVSGDDTQVTVPFVAGKTYSVTFHASGLPKGVRWCATLGTVACATHASIVFANLTPGSYPFLTAPIAGFETTLGHGGKAYTTAPPFQVNVTHHSVSVKLRFTPVTYALTFQESGLPSGTSWSVKIRYVYFGKTETKHLSSKSASITFDVPNGTFTYTVGTVKGYGRLAGASISVVGVPVAVSLAFSPAPAPSTGAAPASPPALPGAVPSVPTGRRAS